MERIERLEEAVAHLTRVVDDLSGVIATQADTIDLLTRRVGHLMARDADRDEGGAVLTDQRPPHW